MINSKGRKNMVETIIFFIVIGTIIYWLLPFILPVIIISGIVSVIVILISDSKRIKTNNDLDFTSELGKAMMKKDMIDSMSGNKDLDSFEETIITKNIIDNMKKTK